MLRQNKQIYIPNSLFSLAKLKTNLHSEKSDGEKLLGFRKRLLSSAKQETNLDSERTSLNKLFVFGKDFWRESNKNVIAFSAMQERENIDQQICDNQLHIQEIQLELKTNASRKIRIPTRFQIRVNRRADPRVLSYFL